MRELYFFLFLPSFFQIIKKMVVQVEVEGGTHFSRRFFSSFEKFDGCLSRRGERGREGSGGFKLPGFDLDIFFMLEVDGRHSSATGRGDDDDDRAGSPWRSLPSTSTLFASSPSPSASSLFRRQQQQRRHSEARLFLLLLFLFFLLPFLFLSPLPPRLPPQGVPLQRLFGRGNGNGSGNYDDGQAVLYSLIGLNVGIYALWQVNPIFARKHFVVSAGALADGR